MGAIANTLVTTTGLGSAIGSSSTAIKDDGSLDPNMTKTFIGTSAAATTTLAVEGYLSHKGLERIYEKESSELINSLSDEELALALEHLELLEVEDNNKTNNKTI